MGRGRALQEDEDGPRFLLDPFEMTNPQLDPGLHVPRGSWLLSPRRPCSLRQPRGWDACHFLWPACGSEPFFPPIQADNWASASAACCSASAFQQTAGASGVTPGSATVIPASPPRAPLAQYCPLGSRMFLSPLHSCEFFYILKRNLFLIFLPGRGGGKRGCLAVGGSVAWHSVQGGDLLPPRQLPAMAPGRAAASTGRR